MDYWLLGHTRQKEPPLLSIKVDNLLKFNCLRNIVIVHAHTKVYMMDIKGE